MRKSSDVGTRTRKLLNIAAVCASAAWTASASAATVWFGHGGGGLSNHDAPSFDFGTVTATAESGLGSPAGVVQWTDGLGVCGRGDTSSGILGCDGYPGTIDGNGTVDVLHLSFDSVVKLDKVYFAFFDIAHGDLTDIWAPDKLNFLVDGNLVAQNLSVAWAHGQSCDGAFCTGKTFSFQATGRGDDFKVAGVEVSQVPLPGTFGLLSLGLAGLGMLRKSNPRTLLKRVTYFGD